MALIDALKAGDYFEILRPGLHFELDDGTPWEITPEVIEKTIAAAQIDGHEPRLVKGHPIDKDGMPAAEPALGILSLKKEADGSLWGKVDNWLGNDPEELLKGYWSVSGGFGEIDIDTDTSKLIHVGVLGASHPMVPGLRSTMSDCEGKTCGYVMAETDLEESEDVATLLYVSTLNTKGGATMANLIRRLLLSPDGGAGGGGAGAGDKPAGDDAKKTDDGDGKTDTDAKTDIKPADGDGKVDNDTGAGDGDETPADNGGGEGDGATTLSDVERRVAKLEADEAKVSFVDTLRGKELDAAAKLELTATYYSVVMTEGKDSATAKGLRTFADKLPKSELGTSIFNEDDAPKLEAGERRITMAENMADMVNTGRDKKK